MPRARFALLLALSGCQNHAKQSVALYEAGDYAGAAHAADLQLASHPDDEGLWQMRIRSALAQGDGAAVAKAWTSYREHRRDDDRELLRDLATATLGQALASPSAKLKIIAIEAIEDGEIEPLADEVARRFKDEDDRVAATAAVAELRGHPDAKLFAAEMLKSDNPEARRIALDGVARKWKRLAITDIEHGVGDVDARVRRVAIRWLGELGDRDAVELVTKRLKDPDEGVRAAAVTACGKLAATSAAGAIDAEAIAKAALADAALAVRLAAIPLLRGDAELVALADDADPMIALAASIAIRKPHPEAAAKAIARAMGAGDWAVRAGAANELSRAVPKDQAVEIARKLAGDKDPRVRLAAARALAHAGDKQGAVAVFAAMLDDLQAVTDLAELGDQRGIDALDSRVKNLEQPPDARAAAAAAHRGAHRLTPGLIAALADPNGLVRVQAAATIIALAR